MRGLEGFLQEAAKNFDLFLKCKIKIKNFKHIVVDEQNKAFAIVRTTLTLILSGRTV
jgi:hypothetical protein